MIRAAAAVAVLALACGCDAVRPDAAPIAELARARFLGVDTGAPPPLSDPGWAEVRLPDEWGQRALIAAGGWYHLRLAAAPTTRPLGVYLRRVHMNAAVYWNGALLGDGGRLEDPMARNWNTPLYFTVPPPLVRPGENELLVRLRTHPGAGLLTPVLVGDDRVLRPRYELRRFLQVEACVALCLGLIGAALFLLGLWWRRRSDAAYLWLGGACLLWAIFGSYLFARDPDLSGPVHQLVAHGALDLWAVAFAGFTHRFVGVARPRMEGLLALCAGLCAAAAAASPPILLRGLWFRLSHAVSLGVLLYVCAFVLRRWRARRTPELSLLALSVLAIGAAGAHDWLAYSLFRVGPRATLGLPFAQSLLLVPYAAPLVFFTLAWHLARRFAEALDAAERWSAERERIYGDLHDDLGARLLSLVIGAESPRQADLARTALADLRDVVSRSAARAAGEPAPLKDLLGDWRAETEQRTAAAGLRLTWTHAPEEPALTLSPDDALHLGRILREAVTNVLRHARASQVRVAAAVRGHQLSLTVEDDGVGLGAAQGRQGRGLRSMRARAARLGGEIDLRDAAPRGARLEVRVPLGTEGP